MSINFVLKAFSGTLFGEILPDEPVWITSLACAGHEIDISKCPDFILNASQCNDPAVVICDGKFNATPTINLFTLFQMSLKLHPLNGVSV